MQAAFEPLSHRSPPGRHPREAPRRAAWRCTEESAASWAISAHSGKT